VPASVSYISTIPSKVWGPVWIALTLAGMYSTLEWADRMDGQR